MIQQEAPFIEMEMKMLRIVFTGYRPHLQVDGGEYLGISLFEIAVHNLGDIFLAKAHLIYWPEVDYMALQKGTKFNVKEGARTVGEGVVVRGWQP